MVSEADYGHFQRMQENLEKKRGNKEGQRMSYYSQNFTCLLDKEGPSLNQHLGMGANSWQFSILYAINQNQFESETLVSDKASINLIR